MKQIQWFPGHMAKALREMQGQINAVDIVIEIVDARIPFSSRNPEIMALSKTKPTLIIMSKADLANKEMTNRWTKFYEENGQQVIACAINSLSYQEVKKKCQIVLKDKIAKDLAKGIRQRPIRALVVGIPNVGKSTFINKMAGRKAAQAANKPGVTKTTQYIKIDKDFVLLDTPGVLWPNFEDKNVGINLALIGSIKQTILPVEELVEALLNKLTTIYPGTLKEHYEIEEELVDNNQKCIEILGRIANSRNFIMNNKELDYDRTITHVLREFANGKIGKYTLEEPK